MKNEFIINKSEIPANNNSILFGTSPDISIFDSNNNSWTELTVYAIGIIENTMVKSLCDRQVCLCNAFILQPVSYASPTCPNQLCNTSGLTCGSHPASQINHCDDQPIIKGVSSDAQINAILTATTDNLWTELFVPEILNIPYCKPDLQKIISLTSKFEILCQRVVVTSTGANYEGLYATGRKLIIEGVLRQRITYISETDYQSVHSAHFSMPVSTFIILLH